jgi:hypothetical protein
VAQSLLSFTRTVAQIAGLGVAGVVVSSIGPQWTLMINASAFVVTTSLLAFALPALPIGVDASQAQPTVTWWRSSPTCWSSSG